MEATQTPTEKLCIKKIQHKLLKHQTFATKVCVNSPHVPINPQTSTRRNNYINGEPESPET